MVQNTKYLIITRVKNIVLIGSLKSERIQGLVAKARDVESEELACLPDFATCFLGEFG